VDARCRYRAPARYDDEILIETRAAMLRGSVLKFTYRILHKAPEGAEHELLAEGDTVHVVCDAKLERIPLPENYAAVLRKMIEEN
jgi:acyl-CoA thioester hydrolase